MTTAGTRRIYGNRAVAALTRPKIAAGLGVLSLAAGITAWLIIPSLQTTDSNYPNKAAL